MTIKDLIGKMNINHIHSKYKNTHGGCIPKTIYEIETAVNEILKSNVTSGEYLVLELSEDVSVGKDGKVNTNVYLDCDVMDENGEVWGLECRSLTTNAAINIKEDTMNQFSADDIVNAFLLEATYCGNTDQEICDFLGESLYG